MSKNRNIPKVISEFRSLLQAESPLNVSADENTNPELEKIKKMGPKVTEQQAKEMDYQDLETECLILRRQLPRLKDAQGKDVTNEFMLLNEDLDKYKLEVEKLQARLAQCEKNPRISSFQNVSGDSIVSQFSMDRAASQAVKNVQPATSSELDFEKEELLAKIETLEQQNKDQKEDITKCHKLIKGLKKLVPEEIDGTKIDYENIDENKEVWIKKLNSDLREIDRNWRSNGELVRAIDNFLNGLGLGERPSLINDRLAAQRLSLVKLIEDSSIATNLEESSFQPRVFNATVPVDLLMNGTFSTDDIGTMKAAFSGFRKLCSQMFKQLQGTAAFLEHLIRSLENEEDEQAKKLLAKIRSIHLGLNNSMHDASIMIDDAQKAEESLDVAFERSVRMSMAPVSDTSALNAKIIQLEEKNGLAAQDIADLESVVRDKEVEVFKFQQQFDSATKKSHSLEASLVEKEKELSSLRETCESLKAELDEMKSIADDREEIIKKCKQQLSEAEERMQGKTHVPEILEEMSNIYTTLSTVSNEMKKLQRKSSASSKPKPSK